MPAGTWDLFVASFYGVLSGTITWAVLDFFWDLPGIINALVGITLATVVGILVHRSG